MKKQALAICKTAKSDDGAITLPRNLQSTGNPSAAALLHLGQLPGNELVVKLQLEAITALYR